MKAFSFVVFAAALLIVSLARKPGDEVKMIKLQPSLSDNKPQLGDIWKNCTSEDSIMKIERVTLPKEIKAGQSINVMVKYTLSKNITGGSLDIDMDLAGDQQTLSVPLCDALNVVNLNCPLGETTSGLFNVTATIPFDAPIGHYTGKVTGSTDDKVEFMCVTLDFMMMS